MAWLTIIVAKYDESYFLLRSLTFEAQPDVSETARMGFWPKVFEFLRSSY
jgi:hypothetical protein